MQKQRNRRLRKKLYVGEFAKFGFRADAHFDLLNHGCNDQFFDDFADFLESRELLFVGGASQGAFDAYVIADARYESTTEDDRQAVQAWLAAHPKCSEVVVSEMQDMNDF